MLGFLGEHDCTTLVEDSKLSFAGDYMSLVSSGMTKDSVPEIKTPPNHDGDDFELFYGVQNSPGYKKKKIESLTGLACGDDCNCSCKKKNMSGLGNFNLGPNYGAWPPGPKPEPASWTAPNGVTWTLVNVDNKWVYQSSRDSRLVISTSNLYDMMGIKKDENLVAVGPIPGTPNKDPNDDWRNWKIGGYGAGWVILGAIGVMALLKKGR